jgi:hypothetical protein
MNIKNKNTIQDLHRHTKPIKAFKSESDNSIQLDRLYFGIVKDNRDIQKMGRLKVYIPEFGGNPSDESNWITVSYCSPFAGSTSFLLSKKDSTKYTETQLSYGFWAIPPDLENIVVVGFINGDPSKGIWFGCVYQQFMNHMVPGIASNKSFDKSGVFVDEKEIDPPVAEYNKRTDNPLNYYNPTRPRFDPLHDSLYKQGLYADPVRGPSNSSARRESPSQVFGILTPRGHTIYIDDGEIEFDNEGKPVFFHNTIKRKKDTNEFIRIRTRTGTQILLNDTTGYIYMNTKEGNTWLELSDKGIDIFTYGEFSIRAQRGLNIHTDGNLNIHAKGNIGLHSENNISMRSENNFDILSTSLVIESERNLNVKSGKETLITAGRSMFLKASNMIAAQGDQIHLNSFDVPEARNAKTFKKIRHRDVTKDLRITHTESIVNILVTHEPYTNHIIAVRPPPPENDAILNSIRSNGNVILNETPFEGDVPQVEKSETINSQDLISTSCIDIVSAEFESAGGDPSTIAYDPGPGGWSYGSYQIASGVGTMSSFLKWLKINNDPIADELEEAGGSSAAIAGDKKFQDKWKEIARRNPSEFRQKQHSFIANTHLNPVYSELRKNYDFDPNTRSLTLRSVLYSTSVQHGPTGARNIVNRALSGKDPNTLTDEEIIKAIYNERFAKDPTSPTGLKYFRSPELVRRGWDKGLKKRAIKEPNKALVLLSMEQSGNLPCKEN